MRHRRFWFALALLLLLVSVQLWYRDPQNSSNQTTSLSDGLQFSVCP